MGRFELSDLPPLAFELVGIDDDGRSRFAAVEARPCGERLVIADHDVDLYCDRPEGHQDRDPISKHRAILDLALGHTVKWCDGRCSEPCRAIAHQLPFLQRVRRSQP